MSKPNPFRKMRLVPMNDDDTQVRTRLLTEKRIRQHDPIVSAMADLLPDIEQPRMRVIDGKRRKISPTAAVALQAASMSRYKTLEERRARGRPDKATPAAVEEPEQVKAIEPIPPAPDVTVSKRFEKKLAHVMDVLDKAPGAVGRTASDELVINGTVVRGTSYTSAMRNLFVNTANPAPGTRQLVNKLRDLGVPRSALSSKVAQVYYSQAGSGFAIRFPGRYGRVLHVY